MALQQLAQRARGVTSAVADPYSARSLSAQARARRWQKLGERFPQLADMRVLDLGGDQRAWRSSGLRPAQLVLVNLFEQEPEEAWVRTEVGDACDLPGHLRAERFDLVFSNSVIEHVGGHWRRQAFADAVHEAGDHHWIQTPWRYFPIEPHWLAPGFQWLPLRARQELTQRWPLGHRRAQDPKQAVSNALGVELLTKTEMQHYFPESEIVFERIAGLPKSLIAIR